MQTKLRLGGMLSLTIVAGLLWTSALAAAPAPTAKKNANVAKVQKKKVFGGRPRYVGVASWYGKQNQGRKMANGKPFDRRKMTAAAWNIPLGTMVRVVNLKNGNFVDVTVTDRGPHPRLSRAIDLSEAAATKLDYIDTGLTSVFIIPVAKPQFESAAITARLIEPDMELPVQFDEPFATPAIVSSALMAVSLDQSR
jgi:rare lipoprotein A